MDFDPPSERSSRRARIVTPPSRAVATPRAPSSEFACPSAHQDREHPLPSPARASSGHGLASTAAFRLRRFDDLDGFRRSRPPPGFPGEHSWAFVLQGSSRAAGSRAVSDPTSPPDVLLCRSRSRRGLSPRNRAAPPGACSSSPTFAARCPVSLRRGPVALLDFLWDRAPRTASPEGKRQAAGRPHHVSDCERTTTFEREPMCRFRGAQELISGGDRTRIFANKRGHLRRLLV